MNQTKKAIKAAVSFRPVFIVYRQNEYECVPEKLCVSKEEANKEAEKISNRKPTLLRSAAKGMQTLVMMDKNQVADLKSGSKAYVLMKNKTNKSFDMVMVSTDKSEVKARREKERAKIPAREYDKYKFSVHKVSAI